MSASSSCTDGSWEVVVHAPRMILSAGCRRTPYSSGSSCICEHPRTGLKALNDATNDERVEVRAFVAPSSMHSHTIYIYGSVLLTSLRQNSGMLCTRYLINDNLNYMQA
eukprot:gb/GECG01002898.1/.p1 GENE.gb/GECG01002898.1/~~gb/GECG01002898.1/.p1  ORF type:complete len:109 (+),score=4.04 gb/GECG01002898.1/:1-327(+)